VVNDLGGAIDGSGSDLSPAETVAEEIRAMGGEAVANSDNVASWEGAQNLINTAVTTFGDLHVVVNNAGMGDINGIEDTTLEEWNRTIDIDQTGVFLGMKIPAPYLKQSKHASIINISSIFGSSGGFGLSPAYHAAKGAVRTLTKNLALHWATEGIRVNSIHPGFISTPILETARDTPLWDSMTTLTPMAHLGEPEDVAAGVAYLASDDAKFVTGLELYIDGGYMAR
jgi:NAD(P)-dependent dehydrogenase (short-subunit alcohol dehydrogenase family)